MSHEVIVVQQYDAECKHCAFQDIYESAGEAETDAKRHIEYRDDNDGLPHWNHIVDIRQVTAVGRNL